MKYLFKYVYKGHDCATAVMQGPVDELKQYLNARYVSPPEAIWRQFEFRLHASSPPVTRLQIHLPDEHRITFNAAEETLEDVVSRTAHYNTSLTEYFVINNINALARDTLYQDMPKYFTWNSTEKKWNTRKKGTSIGRMYFVGPSGGERFFLRTLLTVVKGARSYEDIRSVDGNVCETFKAACVARGLYESDDEWHQCLTEASVMQTGSQLRSLFITILTHGPPANPSNLWEDHKVNLSDDCAHRLRQHGIDVPTEDQIYSLALLHIQDELARTLGKTLVDYGLPEPDQGLAAELHIEAIRLIRDQLETDLPALQEKLKAAIPTLNADQKIARNAIIDAYEAGNHGVFFIDGPGGTGKTYLENIILQSVRSKNDIALAVASSGIAALLLDKGWTAHSRFKIPLQLTPTSQCAITRQSDLAKLLRRTKLIIWDEAPMMHKMAFETLDRTLRDILDNDHPFGGLIIVMCGDFRQLLPVVPKGSRPQIVMASIKESYIWQHIQIFHLRINMRTQDVSAQQNAELGGLTFADWLLALGEDRLSSEPGGYIKCPKSMIVQQRDEEHGRASLIDRVYP